MVKTADFLISAKFKFVRIGSERNCHECNVKVPKGSLALNVSGRIGYWYNEYYCSNCDTKRINQIPDVHDRLRQFLLNEKARLTAKEVS